MGNRISSVVTGAIRQQLFGGTRNHSVLGQDVHFEWLWIRKSVWVRYLVFLLNHVMSLGTPSMIRG